MNRSVNKPRTIYLFWKANQAVKALIDHYGQGEGVTLAQYTVLWYLSRRPGTTGAELAREIAITPQSINEMTTSLCAAGLVIKERAPANKKNWLLSLTEAGRERLMQIERIIDLAENDIFVDASDDELREVRGLLTSVISRAKAIQVASGVVDPDRRGLGKLE